MITLTRVHNNQGCCNLYSNHNGAPDKINDIFNPKMFINVRKFNSDMAITLRHFACQACSRNYEEIKTNT